MILFVLTGGIGSGKSSVASRLVTRNAMVIDADLVARELQQPGGAVFNAMVERWGDRIVGEDGNLARPVVASIVFGNEEELAALNKMAGPAVRHEMNARARAAADGDQIVVMDIPLYVEGYKIGAYPGPYSGVIVVDLPPETAVERLVAHRGFSDTDAWARIEAQVSRSERVDLADFVVDNSGTPDHLDAEMDRLWAWMRLRSQVEPPPLRTKK